MSKMPKFLVLTTVIAMASCSPIDKSITLTPNTFWIDVNQVVKDIHTMQDNLVQSVEEGKNQQKRSFSIIVTGILRYLQTNTQPRSLIGLRVNEPIDVYAAETVRSLAREQLLLELPLYAAKKACRPEDSGMKCVDAYAYEYMDMKKRCPNIDPHFDLLDAAMDLHTDEEYRKLMNYVLKKSKQTTDKEALEVLIEILVDDKHVDIRDKLKKYYERYAQNNYKCIEAHYKEDSD